MHIKILGTGCKKCEETEKIIKEYLKKNNIEATVEKVTGVMEIAAYGVMITPSVVVDGKVKIVGKVPKEADIEKALK